MPIHVGRGATAGRGSMAHADQSFGGQGPSLAETETSACGVSPRGPSAVERASMSGETDTPELPPQPPVRVDVVGAQGFNGTRAGHRIADVTSPPGGSPWSLSPSFPRAPLAAVVPLLTPGRGYASIAHPVEGGRQCG